MDKYLRNESGAIVRDAEGNPVYEMDYLKDESGAIVRDAAGKPVLKQAKFAPAYGEAKAKQDKIDRENKERLKQSKAILEERNRVAEAKKKPSILGRDHPLFFGKDRLLHNFWIGILLFLLFIFFGQFTDYKYR